MSCAKDAASSLATIASSQRPRRKLTSAWAAERGHEQAGALASAGEVGDLGEIGRGVVEIVTEVLDRADHAKGLEPWEPRPSHLANHSPAELVEFVKPAETHVAQRERVAGDTGGPARVAGERRSTGGNGTFPTAHEHAGSARRRCSSRRQVARAVWLFGCRSDE